MGDGKEETSRIRGYGVLGGAKTVSLCWFHVDLRIEGLQARLYPKPTPSQGHTHHIPLIHLPKSSHDIMISISKPKKKIPLKAATQYANKQRKTPSI